MSLKIYMLPPSKSIETSAQGDFAGIQIIAQLNFARVKNAALNAQGNAYCHITRSTDFEFCREERSQDGRDEHRRNEPSESESLFSEYQPLVSAISHDLIRIVYLRGTKDYTIRCSPLGSRFQTFQISLSMFNEYIFRNFESFDLIS